MKYNVFEPKDELLVIADFRKRLFEFPLFDLEANAAYNWFHTCIDNCPIGDRIVMDYANKIIDYIKNGYKVELENNQFFTKYSSEDIAGAIMSGYNDSRLMFVKPAAYRRVFNEIRNSLQHASDDLLENPITPTEAYPISKDAKEALKEVSQLPTDERYRVDPSILKNIHRHTMVPIFNNLPMALHNTFVSILRCSECGYTEKYTMNLMNGVFTLEEIKC